MNHNWLQVPLIFLAAAVVAVPLARALRLGTIVGYLAAGIVIGPEVLGLIHSPETVLELAEFGVVLMLFLVGLELEPRRLWSLRRQIFLWGTVQLVGSALALLAIFMLIGWPWRMGLVAALGLAMSSTAVALAVMAERNLGSTTAGQSVLSIRCSRTLPPYRCWRWCPCSPWALQAALRTSTTAGRRSCSRPAASSA